MSIVDCAIDAIASCGAEKVSIMGSMLTSDVEGKSPYGKLRDIPHIHCEQASKECREKQQRVINAAKRDGPDCREAQELMASCLEELGDMHVLVLSCTELPLVMAEMEKSETQSTSGPERPRTHGPLAPTEPSVRSSVMAELPMAEGETSSEGRSETTCESSNERGTMSGQDSALSRCSFLRPQLLNPTRELARRLLTFSCDDAC